jgi:phasin
VRCKRNVALHKKIPYMGFIKSVADGRTICTKEGSTVMSKTTKQTADAFSIPAFDATAVTDQVREFTEKGVAQSKEAYAKIKDQAEAAQKTLETTFETAQSNTAALSLKALAALRANTEASFAHIEALIGVKSFGEVIELQSAFVRKQAEALTGSISIQR